MNQLATVRAIYEAFGRQDVPAILEHIADDAKWEHWPANSAQAKGVPTLASRDGKPGVLAFLGSLAAIEMHDFRVLNLLEGGNQVAVSVAIDFTVKSTGRRAQDEELHLWTFNDQGRIAALRHYVDTAKQIEAFGC